MTIPSAEKQDTADKLIEALEQERFVLYFQDIKPLSRTAGAPFREILIRFLDEEETLLPPGTFIPVLESYNLMYTLDRWIISRVLSRLRSGAGDEGNLQGVRYSINLSAETFRNHGFPAFLEEQLSLFNTEPASVLFEITEADAGLHRTAAVNTLKRVKKAGCGLVLTGYSGDRISHEQLAQLAFDLVKIDGDMVRTMHVNDAHLKTVDAINRICHAGRIRTVGELVETRETVAKLREVGVDYAQGFAVAAPKALE